PIDSFFRDAHPTIKCGLHFDWSKRSHFNYSFGPQTVKRFDDLPRYNGFYCQNDFTAAEPISALMDAGKAFPNAGGNPVWGDFIAYHIENETFVEYMEKKCAGMGIELIDTTLEKVEADEAGVKRLQVVDGGTAEAELFVDASGFRSLLLGEAMKARYNSFSNSLYCDRAVVGSWDRTDEPILPYTRAETMDAGWCWQIEHAHRINRGYVHSSRFISEEDAEREFRTKNPKVNETTIIKFRSGYFEDSWVGNVVGVGNACGFVEPLESTALMVICDESRFLSEALFSTDRFITPTMRAAHNRLMRNEWESIRGFLAIHYKFNERLDTTFWKAARADAELGDAQIFVDYYRENGPTLFNEAVLLGRNDIFGLEGHLSLMLGQQVPYLNRQSISPSEWQTWRSHQAHHRRIASQAFTIRQAIDGVRSGNMHFVMARLDMGV
ncbi:MAG TPA: tryptophan 7-halogenase, partial [Tepidisphaeraceae bacterium]|nr:tryptophan 7-halogenase [Tepidisphaeraceae bacterium]